MIDQYATQLVLPIRLPEKMTVANFLGRHHVALRAALSALWQADEHVLGHFFYLFGPSGSGRSHLLYALCQQARAAHRSVMYVSLQTEGMTPAMLADLAVYQVVCLDDVDALPAEPAWQEALFHLFNALQAQQHTLVVSALIPAHQLIVPLADLRSRLLSGASFRLTPLDDHEKHEALLARAAARGLTLDDEVVMFILNRSTRSTSVLFDVLNRLDTVSWQQQRRVTIPFVKQVMGW